MTITCLASSSAGNAFVIQNQDTVLLLEAGLEFKELIHRLNQAGIRLSQVKAVAISHEHGDHAKAAPELSKLMPVVGTYLTLSALPKLESRYPLKEWQKAVIGSLRLQPFYVDHDVVGACGYIIDDLLNKEKLLFITDTKLVRYDFSKLKFDYIMIECNHVYDYAIKDAFMRRKAITHMSLDATKQALSKMDLSKTKAIYLIHLSDSNSDEPRMIKEVKEMTGKMTYACLKDGGVHG